MKKFAALTLALILCLGMVSCGDSSSGDGDKETTTKAAETTAAAEGGDDGGETAEEPEAETTTEAEHVEALNNKTEDYQNYDKTDLGAAYDTYVSKDASFDNKYDIVFVGGDYLDGAFVLDHGDTFSLAQNNIFTPRKATVAGQEVDMTQSVFTNDNCISAKTSFVADDIGYDFFTYAVDNNLGGSVLHMSLDSDSALTQGELSDAAALEAAIADMLSDDNKEATQEKFVGYLNDILGGFTF